MHVIFLLLLLLLLPAPARGTSLHKCLGADGVASYQSLPCAPGQRTAWTRVAPPLAAPAPPRAESLPARQRVATAGRSVAREAADPSASRCASARRAADLTRDRLWNRLSFRQRSDLDARVSQACARR